MTYNDIKNATLGKSYDIDGYYGAQCWDFANYVMKNYYNGKVIHCGITGYVKDIAAQKKTNGILDFMEDVGLKAELKPGDICIWGNCTACPDSHIAIYDHDTGQNHVYFLGQNQGASYVNVKEIPVSGIIAVFRPKKLFDTPKPTETGNVLNTIPVDFIRENGTFTASVESIKIRQAPSVSGKDSGYRYKKGESVKYDGYVKREGFVWISWISANDGTRRWMAAGELVNGVNKNPYGVLK